MLCHGHYNNGSDARRADNVRINEEKSACTFLNWVSMMTGCLWWEYFKPK